MTCHNVKAVTLMCLIFIWVYFHRLALLALQTLATFAAQVDASTPLQLMFKSYPWSESPDAELADVLTYVKKSKYLHIPDDWIPYVTA